MTPKRLRLLERRLAVADPDLDGRKGEVRAYAPPELGVLGYRPGVVQEADVALVLVPIGEHVGHATARNMRVKICVRAECR